MKKNLYAAIMAGGAGTRFWPASRAGKPKQFLDVLNTGRTLIQQTFDRYSGLIEKDNIRIVSGEKYKALILDQLPLGEGSIIPEPNMRNTAAAVALSAFDIAVENPNAVIVMTPADHHIGNEDEYRKAIHRCAEFASGKDVLITLGMQPKSPHTGYGYIKRAGKEEDFFKVAQFTEKPKKQLALEFLQSGDYYWNAGIFIWSAASILKAFSQYAQEIYKPLAKLYVSGRPSSDELSDVYAHIPSVSVDYAIMEKAENVYTFPADFGWSDLGSWSTIYELLDKGDNGHVHGNSQVESIDSENCFVRGPGGKLYALIGMKDTAVIDMDDVTVVFPLSRDQEIKDILKKIRQNYGKHYD